MNELKFSFGNYSFYKFNFNRLEKLGKDFEHLEKFIKKEEEQEEKDEEIFDPKEIVENKKLITRIFRTLIKNGKKAAKQLFEVDLELIMADFEVFGDALQAKLEKIPFFRNRASRHDSRRNHGKIKEKGSDRGNLSSVAAPLKANGKGKPKSKKNNEI